MSPTALQMANIINTNWGDEGIGRTNSSNFEHSISTTYSKTKNKTKQTVNKY